jgi:hypothetical protein
MDRRRTHFKPAESQPPLLQTHPPGAVPDHQVVQHVAVQQLSALDDLAGHLDVFGRGGGVAGWVIVRHDHGRRVRADGLAEEFADAHDRGVQRADVHDVDLEDVVLGVEQDRAQVLLFRAAFLSAVCVPPKVRVR